MRPEFITCPRCGNQKKVGPRGPVPRFCSRQCKEGDPRRSLSEARCSRCGEAFTPTHWRQTRCRDDCGRRPADPRQCVSCGVTFTPKPHLDRQRRCRRDCGKEPPHPCRYCGDPISNPRRKQCGKPDCKRAFDAERGRKWQRQYREQSGQWYRQANYSEQQREYERRRRAELGSSRKRYPAAAAAGDARRRMRMQQARTVERFAPLDVHTRDGWTCQLCGVPIDPEVAWPDPMSASVDHVVPLAAGGAHTMANVQSAHLGCNSRKGDRVESINDEAEPAV